MAAHIIAVVIGYIIGKAILFFAGATLLIIMAAIMQKFGRES